MHARLDSARLAQEPVKAMHALGAYVARCGLEERLLDLVKNRVSQINGCAFCLDMHTKDSRAQGETEQRIDLLDAWAWRETPCFTDRERAALAWAEAVTFISDGVPDPVYSEAREHFTEKELADLTWAVIAINGWNRVAIGFRCVPDSYQPKNQHA
jgi:AhpD family alkylhydroperoxidase